MYTGPHLIKDNLVFGYDTGYGIADNETPTRFYPGMPTANLNADPYHSTKSAGDTVTLATWGGDTGVGSFEVNTSPPGGGMMFINHNTSNPAGTGGTYTDFPTTRYTLTNGVTYTRSWWAKADDTRGASGHICSCNRDSTNTYIVGSSVSLTTEWQRYSHTFTYTGPTSNDWQFRHIIYDASKVYIANVQLEVGSVVSPFVDGTRSSTQSLIDLTKTASIDVSNVSFDSTGQPNFDGTDDYIDLANNLQAGETTASWEFVVKFDVTHDDDTSTYRQLYIQEASVWIGQYYDYIGLDIRKDNNAWFDGDGGRNTTSKIGPVDANIWYHVVFTFNNGVMKGYLNGVLGFTTTKSGMTQGLKTGTTPRRIGRRSGQPLNGDMPVVKMYDKDLSAVQVKQNYNAYKNRFDL